MRPLVLPRLSAGLSGRNVPGGSTEMGSLAASWRRWHRAGPGRSWQRWWTQCEVWRWRPLGTGRGLLTWGELSNVRPKEGLAFALEVPGGRGRGRA